MAGSIRVYICTAFVLILSIGVAYFSLPWEVSNLPTESSVWCVESTYGNQMCHFRNVCFNSNTRAFYFYLGNNSVFSGIADYLQLQKIQLSSVHNHNRFFANVTIVDTKYRQRTPDVVIPQAIGLARFKPDNLMHVIHDDLLPLFVTLEKMYQCNFGSSDFNLLFLDENNEGPYSFLYQNFSMNIYYANNLPDKLICFDQLRLGLDLDSLWYQYGFNKPRGPLKFESFNFNVLDRFRLFLTKNIATEAVVKYALVLERPNSRKILNADFIAKLLSAKYSGKVLRANITKQNAAKVMDLVANADLLIGNHGAEMILSIFMKPQSKIVELFPYGIPSEVVSFLKPLSSFANFPYSYFLWENSNKSNSITHPEYVPEMGGINHLTVEERLKISSIERVRQIYCCGDPSFLRLMYQDTIVGPDIQEVISQALSASSASEQYSHSSIWFYPSHVLFPFCHKENNTVVISWNPPENVKPLEVEYKAIVNIFGQTKVFKTNECQLLLRGVTGQVSVWISAILIVNNHSGPDTFINCTPIHRPD